jgi:hypothetical protein
VKPPNKPQRPSSDKQQKHVAILIKYLKGKNKAIPVTGRGDP